MHSNILNAHLVEMCAKFVGRGEEGCLRISVQTRGVSGSKHIDRLLNRVQLCSIGRFDLMAPRKEGGWLDAVWVKDGSPKGSQYGSDTSIDSSYPDLV